MKRIMGLLLILLLVLGLGLASAVQAKTVTLAWEASPSEVVGYKVYYRIGSADLSRDGGGGTQVVDVGDVLTYSLASLDPTLEYYFAVTAYNTQGQESDFSNHVHSPAETIVNTPPILDPIGDKTVLEGALLSFTVSASDADGDALTYSASNVPSGAQFNTANRTFTWTPGMDQAGVYTVTFAVSDGHESVSETINITVVNVNRPPVLEPIGAQEFFAGDDVNLIIDASDPDGDPLIFTAENIPAGAVFAPSTRSFSWTPSNQQVGTHHVTFVVSDGELQDSEVVPFTVVRANEPPVLNPIGAQSVSEGELLQFSISATTESDNFTFSASGLPTGASFDSNARLFNWTPDYDQAGTFIVNFAVTDGTDSDSEAVTITVYDTNRSPVISGTPNPTASVGQNYVFAPTASDPDGDTLVFSISGQPFWASFNSQTGVLSGTPVSQDVGISSNIIISVSDGFLTDALPAFAIEVVAGGDESDSSDGPPQDPDSSDWVIYASAGTGGYIDPAGEISVLNGNSQHFDIVPATGYYINDVLVNGNSIGLVDSYEFLDVDSHHTIEAVFSQIPKGLSLNPLEPGLKGLERTDGGDENNNLVGGKPRFDLDYRFHVVLREDGLLDQYRLFVVINGYRYPLAHDRGALGSGARFTMTTRLGPAHSHRYYFVAENLSGTQLSRYPATGDLPGPTVELLSGHNMIGLPGNIDPYSLTTRDLLGVRQVYRWSPTAKRDGDYIMVDNSGAVSAGEGYQLRRSTTNRLPDLHHYGEVTNNYFELSIEPGWNLIANPYGGNVLLEDVQVRAGDAAPVDWLTAVSQQVVIDSLFAYLGEDWGGGNEVTSAAGTNRAILVPWIGYWIYVNPVNQPVSLLIPRPLR